MKRASPFRPIRAFTLIELLSVIAIVSLLMAILLPVLARSRSQAKTLKCSAQVKQIVTATMAYLVDFRDSIYWRTLPLDTMGMEWYFYGGKDDGTCHNTSQAGLFNRPNRPLNSYTSRNYELYRCPFDDKPLTWTLPADDTLFASVGNCYVFNATGSGGWTDPTGLAGIRLQVVRRTFDTIIYFDATLRNADAANDDWHPDGRGNFALLDGHVAYIRRPDYTDPVYVWDPLVTP